jgi:hypothetical protein
MRLTGECLIPGFQSDGSGREDRPALAADSAQA